MDDLSAVLDAVRLRGQMYCRLDARSPWAMRAPPSPVATFHGVVRGDAVLQIPGEPDVPLRAGDVAVLCRGSGHSIGDVADRPSRRIEEVIGAAGGAWPVRCGGRGAQTEIVCGGFSAKRDGPPLFALMPVVLHVRGNDRVSKIIALLGEEGAGKSRGTDAIVARLCEALFVEIARAWVTRSDAKQGEWIAALADRRIALALAAIHDEPRKDWSVHTLARAAGMSRSGFAQTFGQLLGVSPLAYVTSWRLYLAKVLLRESAEGITQIADHVGYGSEASLSKAFQRAFGLPPGAYRRDAQQAI